jgi:hypothetical protein
MGGMVVPVKEEKSFKARAIFKGNFVELDAVKTFSVNGKEVIWPDFK